MKRRLTAKQKLANKIKRQKRDAYIKKEFLKVQGKQNPEYDPIGYKDFKKRVIRKMKYEDITVAQAVKKEKNTVQFTTTAARSRTNLVNALKEKHSLEYEELKDLLVANDDTGRLKKFQSVKQNLSWDSDLNTYVLNAGSKRYKIDVSNSPETVDIVELD